jgi:hypothetical protein
MKIKVILLMLIISISCSVVYPSYAQEATVSKKEQRKQVKEQEKKEKETLAASQKEELAKMLKCGCFVFKASRLSGPAGDSYSVPPNLNFLAVNDSLVVYQFAFDNVIGWNGLGGATMEGYRSNYKFDDGGKNKPMTVESRVKPKYGPGSPYFNISVQDDGGATLDLMLNHGVRLKLTGNVTSIPDSGVYTGKSF